jgi:hypothetical protein
MAEERGNCQCTIEVDAVSKAQANWLSETCETQALTKWSNHADGLDIEADTRP